LVERDAGIQSKYAERKNAKGDTDCFQPAFFQPVRSQILSQQSHVQLRASYVS
jgi:hypothetical protein